MAGFDLTFRAPKSVSVLWAIAPEGVARELRAAHDVAVGEALGYLVEDFSGWNCTPNTFPRSTIDANGSPY